MDNQIIKQHIFEQCKAIQHIKLHNIEIAMKEAQANANEYSQGADLFDSNKMQMIAKRDMYASQLEVEMKQLETLNKLDLSVKHVVVEFGSVVITNFQKVFIAIGLGKVMVENDEFYSISPKVPFYQSMAGLKAGDHFEFRGKTIQILDVF
jgi:hypothetical protein